MKEEEIQVYLDDVLFTDWFFLNDSQIRLRNLPEGMTSDTVVSVRRVTDIDKKVVTYTNNTLLNKENLNLSQDQLLYAVQEIYDNNTQFGIDVDNILVENKAEMDAVIEQNKQEILGIQSQFEEETNATIAKNRQEILTIQSQFEKETNDALDEYKEITDAKIVEIDRVAKSVVDTANNALATSKEAEQTADSAVSKADSAVSTANSATTTAKRAETIANTANETSNQAVTIANTATNTSNQALETANTALQNSASAVNTANTSSSKVDMFGESIETVLDAADKIFELDESVQIAVQAAETANTAASTASKAATDAIDAVEEVLSTLDSKADKTEIKNGKLTIQANGSTVTTFTANQEGDSTANIVIPDSAQWGKITGTLSNQSDLQTALNTKANQSTTYTKTEVDNKDASKANTSLNNLTTQSKQYVKQIGRMSWSQPADNTLTKGFKLCSHTSTYSIDNCTGLFRWTLLSSNSKYYSFDILLCVEKRNANLQNTSFRILNHYGTDVLYQTALNSITNGLRALCKVTGSPLTLTLELWQLIPNLTYHTIKLEKLSSSTGDYGNVDVESFDFYIKTNTAPSSYSTYSTAGFTELRPTVDYISQDKLTAGNDIKIENNVISSISPAIFYDEIMDEDIDVEIIPSEYATKSDLETALTQYSKTVLTTEADYNALATKDANTLYLIEE
jgi:hypothetical protein